MDQQPNQPGLQGQSAQPVPTGRSTAPMKTSQFLGMLVIQVIPILNIIMLFVWAFGERANLNKRNYARALLLLMLIIIVLSIGLSIAFYSTFISLFGNIGSF